MNETVWDTFLAASWPDAVDEMHVLRMRNSLRALGIDPDMPVAKLHKQLRLADAHTELVGMAMMAYLHGGLDGRTKFGRAIAEHMKVEGL